MKYTDLPDFKFSAVPIALEADHCIRATTLKQVQIHVSEKGYSKSVHMVMAGFLAL